MITREQLLARSGPDLIDVPGVGEVYLRRLSWSEVVGLQDAPVGEVAALLLRAGMVNADGSPLLQPEDDISDLPAAVALPLVEAVKRHSALDGSADAQVERAAKN